MIEGVRGTVRVTRGLMKEVAIRRARETAPARENGNKNGQQETNREEVAIVPQ